MKKSFPVLTMVAFFAIMLNSCAPLPTKDAVALRSESGDSSETRLSKIVIPAVSKQGNNSGFLLLRDGECALTERLYLADMAEHSIDTQYYIWNSDKSGKLLMQRLLLAAERGVSVRLLLDDFSVGDRNDQLLVINSHPNIQVRVNNPFITRTGVGKWLNFAFDFDRLNRRMHNKTYTVDGTVAITGGRNIGDEYFNQNEHLNFHDTDLLSVGPVVSQVSESFSKYWNSPWAVPIEKLVEGDSDKKEGNPFTEFLTAELASPLQISLPIESNKLEELFQKSVDELVWAPAVFIADDPWGDDKKKHSDEPKRVAKHLLKMTENSSTEVLVESAYFVLNKEALELVGEVFKRGVTIRVLTNSMASNDVLPNHASYAMVREDMLSHGIELFELRPDAASCLELVGRQEFCDNDSVLGLHAKAAVFDRKTVYVGSLNLNLRSAYLNTEAAMIIESPILADRLAGQIELNMARENSWQPVLKEGKIQWITENNGEEEISEHEPNTSWGERVEKGMLILLPGSEYF